MWPVHRTHRDERLIERLIALKARFWHYVTTDTPPPTDGSNSAAVDSGKQVGFSQDSQMSALFTDLQEARFHADKYKALEEQYKLKIQKSMATQLGLSLKRAR